MHAAPARAGRGGARVTARVLLVEDEPTARELLASGLARAGYEVDGACDGIEALERLTAAHEFVVTDIVMPRLDGIALLEELARRGHAARRIVITSFADKERVVQALNHGADYLIEKPFTAERLCGVLEHLGARRAAEQPPITQYFRRRLAELPLTARERELVELVLRGDSNKQIAQRLGIGEQSVKNMLSRAYATLGVQSRGELFHRVFPI
ncbi:MAG: response regulator transcription factor [Planctomycetota bacterium]|nr:MAG: response regulator transcription factor [Planctomycetota bacterium]